MARRFSSFDEFFPYYVAMHRHRLTRQLHAVGTLSGAAIALSGVRRGAWRRLGALPLLGYGFAWPSHFIIEKNNPASFGNPLWSFRGDWKMIAAMLRGRDSEMQALADSWWTAHPDLPVDDTSPVTITAP